MLLLAFATTFGLARFYIFTPAALARRNRALGAAAAEGRGAAELSLRARRHSRSRTGPQTTCGSCAPRPSPSEPRAAWAATAGRHGRPQLSLRAAALALAPGSPGGARAAAARGAD